MRYVKPADKKEVKNWFEYFVMPFKYTPQSLRLAFKSSPSLSVWIILLTVASAVIPLGIAYTAKLIVDAVMAAHTAQTMEMIGLEAGLMALQALVQRVLFLYRSLLGARLGADVNIQILEKAVEKLSMVGLRGVETLMPAQLSGGMKKRVGLARAICSDPEVLLYDEPTTGLDPIMSDAINELILNLARHLKVTSVVVTHDMTSAYKIASRIGMLYEGKLIEVGTPDQIKNSKNEVVKQFVNGLATGPIVQDSGAFFDIKNHSMKKVKP
jgi:ABC-type proline/glycine betaine transport system ATPase subunit